MPMTWIRWHKCMSFLQNRGLVLAFSGPLWCSKYKISKNDFVFLQFRKMLPRTYVYGLWAASRPCFFLSFKMWSLKTDWDPCSTSYNPQCLFLDRGGDHSGWKRIEAFSKHPGVEIMGAVGGRSTGKPVEVAVVDCTTIVDWTQV